MTSTRGKRKAPSENAPDEPKTAQSLQGAVDAQDETPTTGTETSVDEFPGTKSKDSAQDKSHMEGDAGVLDRREKFKDLQARAVSV